MLYHFGRFLLDTDEFRLSADSEAIPLEPRALCLLAYLITNGGKLVRKQELLDAVWPGVAVTDNALTRSMVLLRRALNDNSRAPEFIETVPKAGYRFIATVAVSRAEEASPADAISSVKSNYMATASLTSLTTEIEEPSFQPGRVSLTSPRSAESRPRHKTTWRTFATVTTLVAILVLGEFAEHRRNSATASTFTTTRAGDANTEGSVQSSGTNADAQEQYQRGLFYFDRRNPVAGEAAFRRAIELDPKFSLAYAGLSQALMSRALLGGGAAASNSALVANAEAEAHKAIDLDPNDAEAYIALGAVQTAFTWDWRDAKQNLIYGLQLSPNNATGNMWYSIYLESSGQTDDAIQYVHRAVAANPLSFFMLRQQATVLYFGHHDDEALQTLEHAREMAPAHPDVIDNWIAWIDENRGLYDQAVEHDMLGLRDILTPKELARLQGAYRERGWRGYWIVRLDQMHAPAQQGCGLYDAGQAYLRIGDRDRAFDSLRKAAQQHCFWLGMIRIDPTLQNIRTDPRFPQLLALVDPRSELVAKR